MRQATIITHDHRKRGAAHGGEARRKMWKCGRDSGLTATSVIKMTDVRQCPKCFVRMTFAELIRHLPECAAAGRTWFETLGENRGNVVAAMTARLKAQDR